MVAPKSLTRSKGCRRVCALALVDACLSAHLLVRPFRGPQHELLQRSPVLRATKQALARVQPEGILFVRRNRRAVAGRIHARRKLE